ncbi:hypothetical protein C6501_05605 [Candidatus Poribacteria bacterium]|nr:MAG: hypothetical protein C6501_05605 [Candidatus Poribacteria bacterium]
MSRSSNNADNLPFRSPQYNLYFEHLVEYLTGLKNVALNSFKRRDFVDSYRYSIKGTRINPFFKALRKKHWIEKVNPDKFDGLHRVVKGSYLHNELQLHGITPTKED